jgi:hypothetical protein
MTNVYKIFFGKPEEKRQLGRPGRTWEDNIKTDLREIVYGGVDWIHLAQDSDRWRALVNTVMWVIYCLTERTISFSRTTLLHGVA